MLVWDQSSHLIIWMPSAPFALRRFTKVSSRCYGPASGFKFLAKAKEFLHQLLEMLYVMKFRHRGRFPLEDLVQEKTLLLRCLAQMMLFFITLTAPEHWVLSAEMQGWQETLPDLPKLWVNLHRNYLNLIYHHLSSRAPPCACSHLRVEGSSWLIVQRNSTWLFRTGSCNIHLQECNCFWAGMGPGRLNPAGRNSCSSEGSQDWPAAQRGRREMELASNLLNPEVCRGGPCLHTSSSLLPCTVHGETRRGASQILQPVPAWGLWHSEDIPEFCLDSSYPHWSPVCFYAPIPFCSAFPALYHSTPIPLPASFYGSFLPFIS